MFFTSLKIFKIITFLHILNPCNFSILSDRPWGSYDFVFWIRVPKSISINFILINRFNTLRSSSLNLSDTKIKITIQCLTFEIRLEKIIFELYFYFFEIFVRISYQFLTNIFFSAISIKCFEVFFETYLDVRMFVFRKYNPRFDYIIISAIE